MSTLTLDDLPLAGCRDATTHNTHLLRGYALCENERPSPDLAHLGTFGTIVADPPWSFSYSTRRSEAGNNGWRGSTDRHYPTMRLDEIKRLPVPLIAADDACLWLWTPNALLDDACEVMAAWGFDYKNVLTWKKTGAFGMGYWMRGSTEHALLGVRGAPKPLRRNQRTCFDAPPTRHSAKPDEAYEIFETLTPGPYADLFARRTRVGWSTWGNEVRS